MTKHDDTGLRMDTLPLDRLRELAAAGPNGQTRAEAKRELEARLAATEAPAAPQLTARVSASEFGTPRPEIVVTMPRGTSYRELRAQMLEVAAELERQLAPTREAWEVQVRQVDEYVGAVHLELMDGTAREVDRAKMVLSAVLGSAVSPDVLPPGPPRRQRDLKAERERRKARAAAEAVEAPPTAADEPQAALFTTTSPAPVAANDAEPAAAPGAPVSEAPPAAAMPEAATTGTWKEERKRFRALAGVAASAFETRLLGYGREHLPAHAVVVLDGGERTAEYWAWLRAEFESTQRSAEV